jgi:hypothetical protein
MTMRRRDFLKATTAAALPLAVPATHFDSLQAAVPVAQSRSRRPATGPLRRHPRNPRYFGDATGRAVLLTGSHTWNNLVDMGSTDPPLAFDFDAYLRFLVRFNHNFIRLWSWETLTWDTRKKSYGGVGAINHIAPHPWARTGPGVATDGKPKFDLTRFDPRYFDRLRERVKAAGSQGIYVSIMLFEGWALQFAPGAWRGHPLNEANNVNGIDGDANGDGKGIEVHTLTSPKVTACQEAYVRKVVDTVNGLDNVLYEISNENHTASTRWQYHMIDLLHEYEKTKPKQHPVGMTFQYRGGQNRTLFDSPADWISPNPDGGYRDNPPACDGSKVILTDTDHLWGIGGNQAWVWKSFLRGLHPLFMDPYDGSVLGKRFDPRWQPIRQSLGYARSLAERINLAAMTPLSRLASTSYCLADPGTEYVVYLPKGEAVTVDLGAAQGKVQLEWFDPTRGTTHRGSGDGGGKRRFTAPFSGAAVLHIRCQ